MTGLPPVIRRTQRGATSARDTTMPATAARLLLALAALLPAASRAAEAFAVLPAAEAPGPDAALAGLAAEVRAALEQRGAGVLGPEALRDRMTGSAPARARWWC